MNTITKEWLQQTIAEYEANRDELPFGLDTNSAIELQAYKLALASLEAEPVCVIDQANLDYLKSGADADVWPASRKEMGDVLLYRTAPPAPANAEPVAWLWSHRKHPSEVSLVRPEDDEKAEGAHWSGWSCQALYAAPPAPVSVPNSRAITQYFDTIALEAAREIMCDVNRRHEFLGGEVQLLSRIQCRIDDACRAAMLQSFGNSEQLNSLAVPDGWVLVPEEPTHEMLEAGDEQFGTYDVYRRMIAASPQQEVMP
ncbi:Uncharacterised protein [Klebsiella pneumoniae]|nr:Uncharacterised protein [Klebsiella pneumoniae]